MSLFGSKKQEESYLGIDISSDSIKLVELKNVMGKSQLVTYGYSVTKAEQFKGNLVSNPAVASVLLREVWEKSGCTTKTVIAALPTSKCFNYVLKITSILKKDLMNSAKVKDILTKQAEKILPLPPSQMQFDYTIVNLESYQNLKDEDEIRDVKFLITAAGTDIVKEYTEVFAKAGLELLSLDIESFAMIRSLVGNDKSLVMTVDFGDKATNMSMIESGVPVLNRSVEVGGSTITQALADLMHITTQQAEQYKVDLPILMQQQQLTAMPKPIADAITPVINEIKFLIQTYYQQVDKSKKLDRIILTGGGALLAGLRAHVEAQTDTRTYIADPWSRVIYPTELEKILKELGPRYSIALGLAMTKIR